MASSCPLAIMWKSKSIFFSTASCELLFSRSFEPLFVCVLDLGMVENVCYILWTARFGNVAMFWMTMDSILDS